MTPGSRPSLWLAALAALLALAWAAAISAPTLGGSDDLFATLEHTLFDWRVQTFGERAPPDDIVIVALDDATRATATMGAERQQLTAVIDALAASGARVLALDILLADAGPEVQDARLAEALRRLPAILAGAAGGLRFVDGMDIPQASAELWPQARFTDASRVGLANIITEASGLPRYVPMVFATSRGIVPSFPLLAASEFAGVPPAIDIGAIRLGDNVRRLDHGFLLPLRPYGPAGTIPTVSAADVLSQGSDPGGVPVLAGKLVVLGVTATGMGDRFPSPFGGNLTGVEIMATAIAHFHEAEQTLTRSVATRRIDAAAAAGLAVLCTLSVLAFPLTIGLSIAAALIAASMAAVWAAFAQGIWLAAALPLLAGLVPAGLAAIWRYARERGQANATARVMAELKKFQSPQLARLVESDPAFLSAPRTAQATILFVDLAGFTAMSQRLGPAEPELLLKRFHRLVTGIVHHREGLVVNYMGDGALAVFGLLDDDGRADILADPTENTRPDRQPDPRAIAAAFDLVRGMRTIDDELALDGGLSCRVGLHFGPVILSRLGDDMQQQFSVSGDSVNLASRLMEAAKAEGAAIAATVETIGASEPPGIAAPDGPPPDWRKTLSLRGRTGDVDILFWAN